jgi:hypothetical protein
VVTRKLDAIGTVGLLALALALGSGCGGAALFPSSDGRTRVDSVPDGADVFVMGERLGATPLDLDDARAFPLRYPAEQRALYGKVVLRHEGCREYVAPLSVDAANHGIVAELDCDEPGAAGVSAPSAAPAGERPSLTERLRGIDELEGQGLISADERRLTRARVLDEALTPLPPQERLRRIDELGKEGLLSGDEHARLRRQVLDSL